jgi:alpha-beta hydrolase superfamily lysophospholipase
MTTERVTIASERDGLALSLLITMPEAPLGIVQISHGMAEHKERYVPLMDFLAARGYACIVHDLRGHGESVKSRDDLGYFGANGAQALVEDLRQVSEYARGRWPNLKLFLLGHSMGSLIARAYLKKYPDLDALILSGTPSYQPAVAPAGLLISSLGRLKGERYRSNFVDRLFFGNFNHRIKNPASPFAWLNTDAASVEAYDRDPLCGFLFTLNGFAALRSLLIEAHSPRGWAKPKKNIPVMFVSGGEDPCMISREKLSEAVNLIRNVGYPHIKVKVYDGMRHEILNEPDRDRVYADIQAFLDECLKGNGNGKG